MTVGRRHVLGLGALGASAVALDACGLPWAKPAVPALADVDRVLANLDAVLAALGALEPDVTRFGVKREHATPAGTEAVKSLLASVCCLGSYRDVPQGHWEEPRVEEHLARTLPFVHRTLDKARTYIDKLSDAEVDHIDKRLQRDPDLTMRIMERVDDYAKEIHAPFEQRTYLRTATAQLAGRFRYEGVKEVTSKISTKFARTLASRKSELGMAPDENIGGGDDAQKTQPTPMRVQFHTRATAGDVRTAVCALEPSFTAPGEEARPILLDWEEARCPTTALRSSAPNPIRGGVHLDVRDDGDNVVTLVVYPPADSTFDLQPTVTSIGQNLKKRLEARLESIVGTTCATSADCNGLRCIKERCVDLTAAPAARRTAVADSHLGLAGETCRADADCKEGLTCFHSACDPKEPTSSKLIKTTGKVAKWGAILLIPPICAIGILVLLVCLFMVIVAGFESVGGD